MALYNDWQQLVNAAAKNNELKEFWDHYFFFELAAYKRILSEGKFRYEGRLGTLASDFGMQDAYFAGFLDGINTSLNTAIKLDEIESDSEISLDINSEKLYFNMHEAKADWLYSLKEWDGVLSAERRKEITKQWRESKQFVLKQPKVGPNDPCPCGSGKKYKKCCGRTDD